MSTLPMPLLLAHREARPEETVPTVEITAHTLNSTYVLTYTQEDAPDSQAELRCTRGTFEGWIFRATLLDAVMSLRMGESIYLPGARIVSRGVEPDRPGEGGLHTTAVRSIEIVLSQRWR